jgi:hypothetical protein
VSAIERVDDQPDGSSQTDRRLKIFINYRHADASGWARALYTELVKAFDRDDVFFDVESLRPGVDWLDEIQSHGSESAIFLALIGTRWAEMMRSRAGQPDEDEVRNELHLAIRSGATIIPTLVDGAESPPPNKVPRDLQQVLARQAFPLRPESFQPDVGRLIEKLKRGDSAPPPGPTGPVLRGSSGPGPQPPDENLDPAMRKHFAEVAKQMLDGRVVPILGSGANSSARSEDEPWSDPNAGCLPDTVELAAYLAKTFNANPTHLAEIAQRVSMDEASRLYETLGQSLAIRSPSGATPVHTFLAEFPAQLERLGIPEERRRPQLIVTTNYDEALEHAFDKAAEPYDLAVYMASGRDRGNFVHIPYEKRPADGVVPEVVRDGSTYDKFPTIGRFADLTRTVIVKIHGAVDRQQGPYTWDGNYVVTEDDYIDYLSSRSVDEIIPQQIRNKLRNSHLLFLGYTTRDWNLRVFLQRIFATYPIRDASWTIQRACDDLESGYWKKHPKVELIEMALPRYVEQLGAHLAVAETAAAVQ